MFYNCIPFILFFGVQTESYFVCWWTPVLAASTVYNKILAHMGERKRLDQRISINIS
jgi:hypothetical protein